MWTALMGGYIPAQGVIANVKGVIRLCRDSRRGGTKELCAAECSSRRSQLHCSGFLPHADSIEERGSVCCCQIGEGGRAGLAGNVAADG